MVLLAGMGMPENLRIKRSRILRAPQLGCSKPYPILRSTILTSPAAQDHLFRPGYWFKWNKVRPRAESVKLPTAPETVTPSFPVKPFGALMRQVTLSDTFVIGLPPAGNRVTVMSSTPPCSPEFRPPKASKLRNLVASHFPALSSDPDALKMAKLPLATTLLTLGSKLPDPVIAMLSLVLESSAVCGPMRSNL